MVIFRKRVNIIDASINPYPHTVSFSGGPSHAHYPATEYLKRDIKKTVETEEKEANHVRENQRLVNFESRLELF